MVMATAASLAVTKDWLVALGLCVGIAERGPSPLEASTYVNQVSAKVRLWPLLRRQMVLDKVAVSGVDVQLESDRRNRVNLEELFRLIQDDPDKSSPWNVIIYQFTLDHAMVNLAAFIPDTPLQPSARSSYEARLMACSAFLGSISLPLGRTSG
jgi:hypothetical protein